MPKRKKNEGIDAERISDLFAKYGVAVPDELATKAPTIRGADDVYITSREYKIFTREEPSYWKKQYEKLCGRAEKILPVTIPDEDYKALVKAIEITELKVTPTGISSFSLFVLFGTILVALFMFFFSVLLTILVGILGYSLYSYLRNYPIRKVQDAQIKASGESILAVLYLVIYMRHTPNLEAAVKFASDNLTGTLANSFRKLLWDVQSRKYKNVSEAFDSYTEEWGKFNKPFTDSIYLIEASLYQTDAERRKELLNRALDRILDGTFDDMSQYAHGLKTPVDTLYTIGIILPVLGLVMFPMMAAFMSDVLPTTSLVILYNIFLPVLVYMFEKMIFTKRPVGFPVPDISGHPDVPRPGYFRWGKKEVKAFPIAVAIFVLFSLPFIAYIQNPPTTPSEIDVAVSMLPILGLGGAVYFYTKKLSSARMKIMKEVTRIERDLSDALFQLGMRIGEGYPPEVAIQRVKEVMRNTEVANFFEIIIGNMKRLGHSFEQAIFDRNYGAIRLYPSPMLKSVMEVLVSSSKKSLEITSVSLINIARYLQNIDRINSKIQDILSETVSGLKFQASVITPIITGVVVGMTSLIIIIVSMLSSKIEELSAASGGQVGPWALGLFAASGATPLYIFQPIVGIYLLQVVILIAILDADIETNGHPIWRNASIASLTLPAVILYTVIGLLLTIVFGGLGKLSLAVGGNFGV